MKRLLASVLLVPFLVGGVAASEFPKLTVTVEDTNVPVYVGSYCWPKDEKYGTLCVDGVVTFEGEMLVAVPPESTLTFTFDHPPLSQRVSACHATRQKVGEMAKEGVWCQKAIELKITESNTVVLPKDKGVYRFDIFGKWTRSDVSYAFALEIR